MKENKIKDELLNEIKKTREFLLKIDSFYKEFLENDLPRLGKTRPSAIVVAEIIADFYTCLETLFLRISRFFENSLLKTKWHIDLLHKMTLKMNNTRIPVISDETHSILLEFLKFRHFKRYYFEFDYDWDKLEFLQKKYDQVQKLLNNDFKNFENFLKRLRE